jgi:hypothetical protein
VERHGKLERHGFVRLGGAKGPTQLHPWPFKQSGFRVIQKPLEGRFNLLVPKIEGGLQIEHNLFADVVGEVSG